MKEIRLKNIELGDTGADAKDKINQNDANLRDSILNVDNKYYTLDKQNVKKENLSQTLGSSENLIPSEKAVRDALSQYPTKNEVALGTILKGNKSNEAEIKSLPNPSSGDTYRALDTNHYWTFDGKEWNDLGSILPNDAVTQSTICNVSQLNNNYTYPDRQSARNAVPLDKRAKGQIITYELSLGTQSKDITNEFKSYIDYTGKFPDEKTGRIKVWNPNNLQSVIMYPLKKNATYIITGLKNPDTETHYARLYRSNNESTDAFLSFIIDPSCQLRFTTDNLDTYISMLIWLNQNSGDFDSRSTIRIVEQVTNKKWVTEQYKGIEQNKWNSINNWEGIDNSINRIDGISYKSIGPESYINLIIYKNIQPSAIDSKGKLISTPENHKHNAAYNTIIGNKKYLTNLTEKNTSLLILFYDINKNFISSIGSNSQEFISPPQSAFFRYNISKEIEHFDHYVYEFPTFNKSCDLSVQLSSDKLSDAQIISDSEFSHNLFWNIKTQNKALNAYNIPIIQNQAGQKQWSHTDFISCKPSTMYNTNMIKASPQFWFYDADFRPITYNGSQYDSSKIFGDFTTPINAYYLRANILGNINNYFLRSKTQNVTILHNLIIPSSKIIYAKKFDYISLGDSITFGAGSTTPYSTLLSKKLGSAFTNLAVSGAKCFGSNGNVLINQVTKIPENFNGIITCMIGINDVSGKSVLGDIKSVIEKKYSDLNADNSFAEAFRLCIETILIKAPKAILLIIPPLKAWTNQEPEIESYRQVERNICEHFAIPYAEIHKRCLISPLTYSRLMPDSLHPNDDGHFEIMRVLWGELDKLLSYLK